MQVLDTYKFTTNPASSKIRSIEVNVLIDFSQRTFCTMNPGDGDLFKKVMKVNHPKIAIWTYPSRNEDMQFSVVYAWNTKQMSSIFTIIKELEKGSLISANFTSEILQRLQNRMLRLRYSSNIFSNIFDNNKMTPSVRANHYDIIDTIPEEKAREISLMTFTNIPAVEPFSYKTKPSTPPFFSPNEIDKMDIDMAEEKNAADQPSQAVKRKFEESNDNDFEAAEKQDEKRARLY